MDIRTERLLAAFRDSGLSQTDLCAKTGLSKGALSSYLSGRYFPKQKALEKLSHALNVSVNYLMGIDEERDGRMKVLTAEQELLVSFMEDLNEEGREKLLEFGQLLIKSGQYKKHNQLELVQEEA